MTLTEPTIIKSKLWPPGEGRTCHTIFEHRDGRRVHYIRGVVRDESAKPTPEELLKSRGNINGTHGSLEYFEAFPNEQICCGCVGNVHEWGENSDGTKRPREWMKSSPDFSAYGDYCDSCASKRIAAENERHERMIRSINAQLLPDSKLKQ